MKKTLKLALLFTCLAFLNCGSISNYTNNTLNQEFYKNKTITFILDKESVNKLSYEGPRFGVEVQPLVREVFKESIEELATETKLNLKFTENREEIPGSDIIIEAKITEALWSFDLSTAKMKTTVIYTVKSNGKVYQIYGLRKSAGGAENNNLRKSLKNANYNFLKEFEK